MDWHEGDDRYLLMRIVLYSGIILVPWFFFALHLWLLSHRVLLRQRRVEAKHQFSLFLLVSPTATWAYLCGHYFLGWPWVSAFFVFGGFVLAGFLLLADRLATETTYRCPLCGADRMRLASPVDADPHSAGGIGGVFRCRSCGHRWLLAADGQGWKDVTDQWSFE
jgi:DNA-directed RNA polymerase subunit RPC12/RpoP